MRRLLLGAVALLAAVLPAHAGPLVAGIAALASTLFTIQTLGQLVLGFALSYVAGMLFKPEEPKLGVGGARIDIRVDSNVPRSLVVGRAAVAGSLIYGNTWDNPTGYHRNANLYEMIALADHPVTALEKVFVEGQLRATTTKPDGSLEVDDFVKDGVATASFKFYDGTQTEADSEAVTKLASDPVRPWTANHIGKGVCYARVKLHYDPEMMTGPLAWKFVIRGIKLYDPRKDTSVGGSGGQRWGEEANYAWTENPAVIAYNILRGIYVNNRFFYGLENTDASQLPLTNWFAAMNACDETFHSVVDNAEIAKYTVGGEITVDTEPLEVIKEIIKSCGGRFVEFGGIYKCYIDAPSIADFSFTDEDIVANKGGSFKPILPLDSRLNHLTGSCVSPKKWSMIDLHPVEDTDRQDADGRRISAEMQFNMVANTARAQRLMAQVLKRSSRERRHTITLMPAFFGIEPGYICEWTSVRNGYTAKKFVVDSVSSSSNRAPSIAITEINPSDYDWSSDDEKVIPDGELPANIPAPKVVDGLTVTGITRPGAKGTVKPAIKVVWTDPDDPDAERLAWQLRVAADPDEIEHGSSDVDDLVTIIQGALQPETLYEIRVRFTSREGYRSDWSDWIPVTTPAAYFGMPDFAAEVRHRLSEEVNEVAENVERLTTAVNTIIAQILSDAALDRASTSQQLRITKDNLVASFNRQIDLAVGNNSSLAQLIEALDASVGDIQAGIKAQWVVGVGPNGSVAAYDLTTTAENAKAGFQVAAFQDTDGNAFGQVRIEADRFFVGKSGSAGFVPLFVVNTQQHRVFINGDMVVDSLLAASAKIGRLSALSADLGTVTAGRMRFMATGGGFIDITSNPPRILIDDGQ